MPVENSHRDDGAALARLLDHLVDDAETLIVRRRNGKDVAIIPVEKLRELDTADYLLASPKNRRRLLGALRDARTGKGRRLTVGQLRKLAKHKG